MRGCDSAAPTLIGTQVSLEPFTMSHASNPSYLHWLRDREVVKTLNLPRYLERSVSDDEILDYCRTAIAADNTLFFALCETEGNRFVGTVKAASIDLFAGTADIGIMLGDRTCWGRGYASEALALLCTYLFDVVGLRRLTAGSMANNPAMIRVFEKLGFQIEGVARQQDRFGDDYLDHVHMGCLQDEFLGFPASQGNT